MLGRNLALNTRPDHAGRCLQGQLTAEMHDLKEIVADRPARLAVGQVSLDLHLLAKFQRTINVIRYEFSTLIAEHC
jgi:hypothetical protein